MNDVDLCLGRLRSCQPLRDIRHWIRDGHVSGPSADRARPGRVGSGRVAGQTCHCRIFFHYFSLKLNLICCSKCGFVIPITAAAEASGFGFMWLNSAGGNLWLWGMPPTIDGSVCRHCRWKDNVNVKHLIMLRKINFYKRLLFSTDVFIHNMFLHFFV